MVSTTTAAPIRKDTAIKIITDVQKNVPVALQTMIDQSHHNILSVQTAIGHSGTTSAKLPIRIKWGRPKWQSVSCSKSVTSVAYRDLAPTMYVGRFAHIAVQNTQISRRISVI